MFIPRSVKQKGKATAGVQRLPAPLLADELTLLSTSSGPSLKGKEKEDDYVAVQEEDIATLVNLALSDYALWNDSDLRYAIYSSNERFILLSYILSHSPLFSEFKPLPTQYLVSKSLRQHAQDTLEVRMLMTAPSSGRPLSKTAWRKAEDEPGGFEIRRRDISESIIGNPSQTKEYWSARTIYVENIPPSLKSLASIARALSRLFSSPIQDITFPPSQTQTEKGQKHDWKCRGFAFCILRSVEEVDRVLEEWAWDAPRPVPATADADDVVTEARKFGLRVLAKSAWDVLKNEYLAYQKHIIALSEPVASSSRSAQSQSNPPEGFVPRDTPHVTQESVLANQPEIYDQPSTFPKGCLAFVTNIHPETNRTTLKALFSLPFSGSSDGGGIDYVDFQKGMDSCHVRLPTAAHAHTFASYFKSNGVAQFSGLDLAGSHPDSAHKPIGVELVEGKREALYWEKVPEKVRMDAVRKSRGSESLEETTKNESGRVRKRRRGQ